MDNAGKLAVKYMDHEASPGLIGEREAFAKTWDETARASALQGYSSVEAWLDEVRLAPDWLAVEDVVVRSLSPGARVLDVGVGQGRSSVLLQRSGFRVTAVEPVEELCLGLVDTCNRFDEELDGVVCAPAEALDQVPVTSYEAVIFNASFHHVDDVAGCLGNVYRLLVPGGMVLLANEPVLPLFTTKARWQRKLDESPESLGHYGGNEHIYRHREYMKFLRNVGFTASSRVNPRYHNYVVAMQQLANKQIDGKPMYSPARFLARAIVLAMFSVAVKSPALLRMLEETSLVGSSFVGIKPGTPGS